MFARATITVAAGSDFVIERAVNLYHLLVSTVFRSECELDATYLVLLGSEDRREIIGHGDNSSNK